MRCKAPQARGRYTRHEAVRSVWISSLIAAAVFAHGLPSFAQEATTPLHISTEDQDVQLVAEDGRLRIHGAPNSVVRSCDAPCDQRVERGQSAFIHGPEILDSPVLLLPVTATTLVVRAVRRREVLGFRERRSWFFGGSAALAIVTVGVGAAFGWYARDNIGGLLPGGIQERLLVATATLGSLAGAALIAGIINEAIHPGRSQVFDGNGRRLALRVGLDGLSF